ncbi:MAG: tRNA lysidine(34) synthetase TilS [Pseudomonadota bacterium]
MTASPTDEVFAALDAAAPEGALGVAVSGGGDSMALMLMADDWARARGRQLSVATVDHGLRPESADEAALVVETATALGRPVETLHWSDWDGRGNVQAAARAARRGLLSDWAARCGLSAVAFGHTMDDQAETVLMRLGRGAGVDGLSGMAMRSEAAGTVWLRPLLGVRREALRLFLRDRGVRWVDDPTNDDPKYDRVRARAALETLADLGVTIEGLAETASRLSEARDALDEAAADLFRSAAAWGHCGELRLQLAPLRAAPDELTRRLFRAVLTQAAGAEYGPRAGAEAEALTAMLGLRLGGGRSLHGCVIRPDGPAGAIIAREASAVRPEFVEGRLWDGRFAVSVQSGENATVGPLGMAGDRIVGDLIDAGDLSAPKGWRAAPKGARIASPALWRGDELAAAPLAGFGAGMTARFAVADATFRAATGRG